MALSFTCIGDTFFGLVEERFLGVRGELLLRLIAEVFASRVEVSCQPAVLMPTAKTAQMRTEELPEVRHDAGDLACLI